MRAVVWEEEALTDLEDALAYIAADSRSAAIAIEGRILAAVALLAGRPIGRPGRFPDAFQKLVRKTPYIITYRVSEQELTILRVIHQRRNWPTEE